MELFIGPRIERLIELALDEDEVGFDVTSAAFFDAEDVGSAHLVAKEPLVMAGADVASAVFHRVDDELSFLPQVEDGESADQGHVIARVHGPVGSMLRAERIALNFLQRMCGVATHTARHVEAVHGTAVEVVDTRKTLPGWRSLDKYAVRCGGGRNHRFNLAGGVMIKDNHVAAAGDVASAIRRVKNQAPHTLRIEVEVERLDQVEPAVEHGAGVVMLDNMSNETMRRAVEIIRDHPRGGEVVIEASGNMTVDRLETLGDIGLDVVSVGALTHSAPAVDISMRMDDE